jgi:hypothetical protein
MAQRTAVFAVGTALFLAACAPADNTLAPVNGKFAPSAGNLEVSDAAVFELAPIEYAEPIQNQADQEGGGIFVRDAWGGIPGKPNPHILYLGGALITQPKVAAIYVGGGPVYQGGPAVGTRGPGSADASLVGHFLRNIGGTSYWNINSTYHQDQGTNTGFVQNSLQYTGFWAPQFRTPPQPGSVVGPNAMANIIEAGFATGAITYDPSTLYMVFTGPGVNLGGGFSSAGLSYCAWHSAYRRANGEIVQFSAMPYDADYNPAHPSANGYICTYLTKGTNGDLGAEATVSAMTHEIEETATDPVSKWSNKFFYGYVDQYGEENADKCAYTYGRTLVRPSATNDYYNLTIAGKPFLVQRNWVNGIAHEEGCAIGI